MFDKKVEHHHYMSEKAAKQMAKAAKADQRAAKIQAESAEEAAYQDRKAREAEAEMQLARENPELYMQLKDAERKEYNTAWKIWATIMLGIIDFLIIGSSLPGYKKSASIGGIFVGVVVAAIVILIWYPTIKNHLTSNNNTTSASTSKQHYYETEQHSYNSSAQHACIHCGRTFQGSICPYCGNPI